MIRLHHDIVNSIVIRIGGNTKNRGRDCFKTFYKEDFYDSYHKSRKNSSGKQEEKIVQNAYQDFFNKRQSDVGHYFRNLYTIIKYVNDSKIQTKYANKSKEDPKKEYTRIIRAQLSSYELLLLFYNCLHSVGNEKFKPLIKEYEVLENMDVTLLLSPDDHVPLYDPKAYGDQDVSAYYKEE